MVLANSLRLGDIKNLSGNDGVPYNKKGFVLGGISTIRGFEAGTNERFPNERDLGIASNEIYLLQDRAQFFLVKSELRFPIWGSVGGAVFYDGGLVKVDRIHFKDPYRDAAGFGIRYATPVGPANLEFAWKLDTDRDRGESPFRMHISIGTF
jgi:outer membrane protein assembly factor BamA